MASTYVVGRAASETSLLAPCQEPEIRVSVMCFPFFLIVSGQEIWYQYQTKTSKAVRAIPQKLEEIKNLLSQRSFHHISSPALSLSLLISQHSLAIQILGHINSFWVLVSFCPPKHIFRIPNLQGIVNTSRRIQPWKSVSNPVFNPPSSQPTAAGKRRFQPSQHCERRSLMLDELRSLCPSPVKKKQSRSPKMQNFKRSGAIWLKKT